MNFEPLEPSRHELLPFFVYGTLKLGQAAASRWPHPPVRVETAFVRGTLFDLGPYPVLADGDELISGELWFIAAEHLPATIAVLDQYEGCDGAETDLYVRRVTSVMLQDGTVRSAYAYFVANPQTLDGSRRVPPNRAGYCEWRR